jgi:pantoate--beta-alanine ligase
MAKDLDMDTGVIVCPTIREKDGLAMSSRNAYLEPAQRKAAGVIFRCLTETSDLIKSGIIDGLYLRKVMIEKLGKEPAVTTIDYAGVYDPVLLDELSEIKGDVLIAIALKIGNTRLIDNMLVSLSKGR